MTRYATGDEERIRAAARAREWMRSGFLDARQFASIGEELRTDLKRTNSSLRVVLFIFGTIVVWAAFGFWIEVFGAPQGHAFGWSALAAGFVCFLLADYLVFQFRLYRFGVEEAFAVWSIVLLGAGIGSFVSRRGGRGDLPTLAGLLTATVVSLAVYLRFGYLYAALGAAGCAAVAPFFLEQSQVVQRLLSVVVLIIVFTSAWSLRWRHEEDFSGDDYGVIQSAAWLGIYIVLNLHLSSNLLFTDAGWSQFAPGSFPPAFYWGTYAATWLLPAAGLSVALRRKHRELIAVNLIMAVLTLVTNKMYLGWVRHTWDPVLLGVLLTGTAIAVRHWLARGRDGQRNGFTPERLLSSDRRSLARLSSTAGAIQPFGAHAPAATQTSSTFDPGGGGQSGGGGGGASF